VEPLLAEEEAMDRHKGVVLIDTPGYLLAAKTISKAKGFKPIAT
jgi:ribosomal-protein-alanine N-acetyltransferase